MKHKRFVDLSLPIESGLPSHPPMMIPKNVCCFPIKVKKASAGWVRPIAIIEENV